jgi:hypothetical protein
MPLRLLILVASLVLVGCGSAVLPAADVAPWQGPGRQLAKNTSPAPDVQPEPESPFVLDVRAESLLAHIGMVEARLGSQLEKDRSSCLRGALADIGEVDQAARARRFDLRAAAFDDPAAEGALFAELGNLADRADQVGRRCGDSPVYATRVRELERQLDALKETPRRAQTVGVTAGDASTELVLVARAQLSSPGPKPLKAHLAAVPVPLPPLGGGPPPAVAKPPAASGGHDGSMLLRSAQLTLAVFEVEKKMDAVQATANELGGYMALRGDRDLTVRVPRERFDEALKRIEALGDVLHRSVAAEDVTDQYVDLELRLKNAEAVRARLEKLLENATVKDAVEIHRELAKVTEEIERLSGKLKLLRDRIAFSTITVTFERTEPQKLRSQALLPFPWMRTMGLAPLLQVSR